MEKYRLTRIIVASLLICAVITAASMSNAEVGGITGGVVSGDPDDWPHIGVDQIIVMAHPEESFLLDWGGGCIAGIVVGILHLFEFHWLS